MNDSDQPPESRADQGPSASRYKNPCDAERSSDSRLQPDAPHADQELVQSDGSISEPPSQQAQPARNEGPQEVHQDGSRYFISGKHSERSLLLLEQLQKTHPVTGRSKIALKKRRNRIQAELDHFEYLMDMTSPQGPPQMRSSARPPQVLGNQPLGHRSTNITPSSNNRQSRQSTIVSASQQYQQDQNGGHSTTQDVDIREENEKFARGMKRLRSTPMCSSSWQYKENASRFHAMQEDLRARAALRRSRLDHGHRTDLSLQEANVEISPARGSTNRAPDAYGDSSVHGYQAPSFEYQAHAGRTIISTFNATDVLSQHNGCSTERESVVLKRWRHADSAKAHAWPLAFANDGPAIIHYVAPPVAGLPRLRAPEYTNHPQQRRLARHNQNPMMQSPHFRGAGPIARARVSGTAHSPTIGTGPRALNSYQPPPPAPSGALCVALPSGPRHAEESVNSRIAFAISTPVQSTTKQDNRTLSESAFPWPQVNTNQQSQQRHKDAAGRIFEKFQNHGVAEEKSPVRHVQIDEKKLKRALAEAREEQARKKQKREYQERAAAERD
ncbi:hypothetical protein CLAFUW4_10313 [Fulvia fulva]|uniref:Uncharacterized protein n=1 Tax=Passalora fulva TaxID=5499 RepID=A0A9Q8P7A2_PASFU|nr:uncharacterized protein CLAFUR5_04926 [Fulvia fulva]KAK4616346.1 hypothetical protein CLAFUR4_10317 [Fulvia fulva]KAK4617289.1 hypothetical protein CLAFUR0_10315 [Fulvia fulva]UJO15838.1 hypothetical protein CLAFUR5_04926 [Fulvia fulva]WPV19530.1 hypothetical protein CLAFUW4_10313 [Fulvia fulva]WPV34409.1 hypothetical protein CLAFUW7_10313 [Fulvia fulva]